MTWWVVPVAWGTFVVGFLAGAWWGRWCAEIPWSRVLAEGTQLEGQTGIGVCLDNLDDEPDVIALVELEPGLYMLKLAR